MPAKLFEPYRIVLNQKSAFDHYIGGEFDGRGRECPTCKRRLVVYLNLDLADGCVRFPDKRLRRLPLVYCVECELCHFDFVYRLDGEDNLRMLLALRSKRSSKSGLTSVIRNRRIDVELSATPPELERLAAKPNSGRDLNEEETHLFGRLTNNFAPAELGGYPIVDCYNQAGGRPFLTQRVEDPDCEYCPDGRGRQMRFLASICNERECETKIAPDDMQILYFACPNCAAILVQHSA